jgi:hypothetical protein
VAFEPVKLRPESGANLIKDASDAHAFMMHMNFSPAETPAFWTLQTYLGQSEAKSCRSKQAAR